MLDRHISRRTRIVLGALLLAGVTFRLWAEWDKATHWAPLPQLPVAQPVPPAHLTLTSEGARRGLALAELHIRHRVGFTLTAGFPGPPGNEVSMETGLPLYRFAGCVIEKEEWDFAESYKSRIQEYVDLGGSFENSVHPWLSDFEDLATFWDKLAADRAPVVMVPEAPAIASPDGRSSLRLAKPPADDARSKLFHLLLSTKDGLPTVQDATIAYAPMGLPATVRVAWGPKGSAFALIRKETAMSDPSGRDTLWIEAVDLLSGRILKRQELDAATGKLVRRLPRAAGIAD
jgi:hypothetical protein